MISFLLGLYAVSFFLSAFFEYELLLSFATAVAIHECAHILTSKCLSCLYSPPTVSGTDAVIRMRSPLPVSSEIIILISGAAANILTSILCLIIFGKRLYLFSSLSLFFALVNLLPVSHLDGGRILTLLFIGETDNSPRRIATDILSLVCILSLLVFSAYRMLKYGDSFLSFSGAVHWFYTEFTKRSYGKKTSK